MENTKKTTTAQDWLEMDLKAQSGAIWTDEKTGLQKEKKNYTIPISEPQLLKPDPIYYNGKEVEITPPIILD